MDVYGTVLDINFINQNYNGFNYSSENIKRVGFQQNIIMSDLHARIITRDPNFDIGLYKCYYPELNNLPLVELLKHYIHHKRETGLPNIKSSISFEGNPSANNKVLNYPDLFNKYVLSIKSPFADVSFYKIQENIVFKDKIVSIHCYKLENIDSYFRQIIQTYSVDHHIIITFSEYHANYNLIRDIIPSITLLKIKNKGADIGSKLITMMYLLQEKWPVKYCLFIHSKSDPIHRSNMLGPFIDKYTYINTLIDNNMDIIVPNYQNFDDCKNTKDMFNELAQLFEYMGVSNVDFNSNFLFNGTNTFVLSYRYIYSLKEHLHIFYNHLNEGNDFDNMWYKKVNKSNQTIYQNYDKYINKNLIGNSWESRRRNGPCRGNNSFEHLFERIWIKYAMHNNFNYSVLEPAVNISVNRLIPTTYNKTCIIYLYNERINDTQNQTNLAFFIKYGLDPSRWCNANITILVVINGRQCEVLLPSTDNIHVLYQDTHSNDEGWQAGIKYFENKYTDNIHSIFSHLCLLNSSNFGPVYEDNTNSHWVDILNYSNNSIAEYANLDTHINISFGDPIFATYQPDFVNAKLHYKNLLPSIHDKTLLIGNVGNNKKCLIYAHFDADNIIKHYVIETLIIYAKLGYDIIFYTSSKTITNYEETYLPFKINYFPNKDCGGGTDWYMWLEACIQLKSRQTIYEWITLMNDSMIVGINGIDKMADTISEMEKSNVDFWGHWDSCEITYHIMSSMYNFKYPILDYFIDFAAVNLNKSVTKADIVVNCETKWTLFLKEHGFTTGAVIDKGVYPFQPPKIFRYNRYNVINGPSHNPLNISSWINNDRAFGLKWKYILAYLKEDNLNNEIKERLKYMHIGKYIGYQFHFPHIPIDLYRDNNLFGNETDIFKLVTFKQSHVVNGSTVQFL
jgi:hypothetical protein